MKDIENKYFTIKNDILLKFKDEKADRAVIPEGVKAIGESAFENCRIEFIELPDTLEIIDRRAFRFCLYLKKIIIPDSVKIIGNEAFRQCKNLEYIEIGDGVEKIGYSAFYHCKNLNCKITGRKVKSIGDMAFCWCIYITVAEFPECTNIGDFAFTCCLNLEYIKFGNINRINCDTFSSCHNLKELEIPESVTQICKGAFKYCYNLKLTLPEKLRQSESIAENAFYECREVIYK